MVRWVSFPSAVGTRLRGSRWVGFGRQPSLVTQIWVVSCTDGYSGGVVFPW